MHERDSQQPNCESLFISVPNGTAYFGVPNNPKRKRGSTLRQYPRLRFGLRYSRVPRQSGAVQLIATLLVFGGGRRGDRLFNGLDEIEPFPFRK